MEKHDKRIVALRYRGGAASVHAVLCNAYPCNRQAYAVVHLAVEEIHLPVHALKGKGEHAVPFVFQTGRKYFTDTVPEWPALRAITEGTRRAKSFHVKRPPPSNERVP